MKKFGIYLSYAPTVDLSKEGLGRYLASFLKGASESGRCQFVIVCPSWSIESLNKLFSAENVPHSVFEIVSPDRVPFVLRLREFFLNFFEKKERKSFKKRILNYIGSVAKGYVDKKTMDIVKIESMSGFFLYSLPLVGIFLFFALLSPIIIFLVVIFYIFSWVFKKTKNKLRFFSFAHRKLFRMLYSPKDDGVIFNMFQSMQAFESIKILGLINGMKDVRAWYCPTAFWPSFNNINAPRLLCVPDVVLNEFPVGFSKIGGDRFIETYQNVINTVQGGDRFVTYSSAVKWNTLVKRYGVDAGVISVVKHAPSMLNQFVDIDDLNFNDTASFNYAKALFQGALKRSTNVNYTNGFKNFDIKFIFYASQWRPNKNIISLLKAYNFLLKKKYIKFKLILTCNPALSDAVMDFLKKNNLFNDVIFLHGLAVDELAACYKLANLAVNPSLSEGGCPFTFTEALSVGTPVVMSRIEVAEEVLDEERVQEVTFFDPYDWMSIAQKIEWALAHKEELLSVQLDFFKKLSTRTWGDVVNEHLDILDEISSVNAGKEISNG